MQSRIERRGVIGIILLLTVLSTYGQISDHVRWKIFADKVGKHKLELSLQATLDSGWHIYSSEMQDGGPQKTLLEIPANKAFEVEPGGREFGRIHELYDSNFAIVLRYYPDSARFTKILDVRDTSGFLLKAGVTYMLCNDATCLPAKQLELSLHIPPLSSLPMAERTKDVNKGSAEMEGTTTTAPILTDHSALYIFIAGFLGGLAALLTPCVFPMIPMTVSYFTKRANTRGQGLRDAGVYALSIVVIYVLLGLGVSKLFGVDALNAMSTNVWFNLIFFAVLVVFAASFFGAFEISLPSSWVNKISSQSGRSGWLGIFFLAFTLALVSFSCTGPIVGTLIFESAASGKISGPLWGMIGFSSAVALPFGLFAAFPAWLNALPKSGGWLNSVKVSLGFLELALALKFLSNADLVVQAGILSRELFLVIWVVIFLFWGFYLIGKIRFSHDSGIGHLTLPRLSLSILVFSFALYLVPGLWGAPLKLISGFPPPDFYAEWRHDESRSGDLPLVAVGRKQERCPNGLNCFHDYEEGMTYARKVNKPVLLDFTGWACVNCRKMENLVWTDPKVDTRLRNDFVLISLYVDDQRELPETEKTTKEFGGNKYKISTIGAKWSFLQASKFNINSQPYYAILDTMGQTLTVAQGYSPDVSAYDAFLATGWGKFSGKGQ